MNETIFDHAAIEAALNQMADAMILADGQPLWLVGILGGGATVARLLAERVAGRLPVQVGSLDVSFYRDDLATIGADPRSRPSDIPFDLNGKHLWLVDDVLLTGRTIRAALGELFDYGRPASVRLAVLLDRGGRQLPIQPDLTGITTAAPNLSIKLLCNDRNNLQLVQKKAER